MHPKYDENAAFADSYGDALASIIKQNVGAIVSIERSAIAADLKVAADYVVRVDRGGEISVRVRRDDVPYRDLTIRSFCNGQRTELEKIKAGYCDWFLYGWSAGNGGLSDWMLVDVGRLRKSGLLNHEWKQQINTDGQTGFIAIPRAALRINGCVANEANPIAARCAFGAHRWACKKHNNRPWIICGQCGAMYGALESEAGAEATIAALRAAKHGI